MDTSIVATGTPKKLYMAPQLVVFGGMAAMTASGSGGNGETTQGMSGMTMGKKP